MVIELDLTDIATEAATAGGAVAVEGFAAETAVENKGDEGVPAGPADVVTEFDRSAQRRVNEILQRRDPDAASTLRKARFRELYVSHTDRD